MLRFMKIALLLTILTVFLTGSTNAESQPVGDLNNDLKVDRQDLRIFAWQWLDPTCLDSDCTANLDGTDGVNMADFALLAQNWREGSKVIINEIHYDPVIKTEPAEFIELHNSGLVDANISGWYFSEGISYQFPPGSILQAGGYILVAQHPPTIQAKFGTPSNLIFGPLEGRLENEGEKFVLRNAEGFKIDEVDYRCRFPWPIVGDPPSNSTELSNPAFDNDLGGSWRPSEPEAIAPPTTLIWPGATWRYFKGNSEASSPTSAWRQAGFDDSLWPTGELFIGYGENFISTVLDDMQGNYTSVFLRKNFVVSNASAISNLRLEAIYDDGFNVWINGNFVHPPVNVASENMPFNGTAGPAREDHNWNEFYLSDPSGYLVDGNNVIAIQLFNSSMSSSSDCFLDVQLKDIQLLTTAGPTPGEKNTTYSTNIAPQMRQVSHKPKQPRSGEDVKITVKVTDPDGVKSVILSYQLVYPGSYIEIDDPEYGTNWTDANSPMTDDGTGGDEVAGDNIYTTVMPGSLHSHRLLMRYRITATDNTDLSITGPYAHDPQPNFAYFVYDGVPGWTGAIEPGSADPIKSAVVYYSPAVLTRIPVYHLISKKDSVEHSTWIDRYGGDLYKWNGTLVYDGDVYDHIRYRARGGVWRYAMGKNMWKFDFNRGHYFQAYDDYGKKYDTTWDKVNFSACIQQGDYQHRGEQGMIEAASFLPFNLMGVEAPKTHWVHYRIIDEAAEFGSTQYDGDFWGLYMVIEQMDGRFLDEHGLPDGNLYKIEGHNGELNNQGPNSVTDKSDLNTFKQGYYYDPNPTEQWWRDNVNIESYYGYRAVIEGVHHGDVGYGKNYFFYQNPETGIWDMLPWDVDLCWANNMYGNGEDPFKNQGAIFNHSAIYLEYHNRLREFHDLLYNSEQMDKLLDDLAAIIDPLGGGHSIVDADRAMWDYNPIMTSGYVNSSKAGAGRFYQKAATKDFRGMVQILKD
ncbi:MAG: CotH kinase family protein, partial [Planctomycetota bacterium]